MRFVFPSDVLDPDRPDDAFSEQIEAFREIGFSVAYFSVESAQRGERAIYPSLKPNETVVYRGWMMNECEYRSFCEAVISDGAEPFTDIDTYLSCHHLPNWYPHITDLTPRTVTFDADADLKAELDSLGWGSYFIKDYVKSLKTESGSLLHSTENVEQLVADMVKFRGEIEGGFCVREVEDFVEDSEIRYFVINGKPFGSDPDLEIPKIVAEAASRIGSRFFTVDVVRRADEVERIVEIGDGPGFGRGRMVSRAISGGVVLEYMC